MKVAGIRYVQGRNSYTDRDSKKFGLAIHNTSNDASDEGEASYATRRTDGTSAHFYVDADSVTQSLDTRAVAGHAGSDEGNQHAIAIEVTGANGWTRDRWLRSVAWDKLGQVLAEVIRHHWPDGSFQVRHATVEQMRANPRVKALYGHDDMRRAWGGTTHTDPGPNFPWDKLLDAIHDALHEEDPMALTDADIDRLVTKLTPALVTRLLGQRLGRGTRTVGMQLQDMPHASAIHQLRLQVEAVQAALDGDDHDSIEARIERLADDIQREGSEDEARDAELRALIVQVQSGQLEAEDAIRRVGELVQADTADAADTQP